MSKREFGDRDECPILVGRLAAAAVDRARYCRTPYHRVVLKNKDETPSRTAKYSADDGRGFWSRLRRRLWKPEPVGLFRNLVATRRPARVGNTIPLVTLAPAFRPEHHQVYVDLLERALRHPATRSVALTGSYGSGKSSVLRGLGHSWWDRRVVLELSLSTLDPDLAPAVQADNPAEKEMSNRIQKELVKQLLYQLPTWKTPASRFPRASKPSWISGLFSAAIAVAVSGAAWIIATLAGWQTGLTERLGSVGWTVPLFWYGLTAGVVLVTLSAWNMLAGRYALRAGLKAGALTVNLEPTSSSYFDQYLDEIVYFFQVSRTSIVLIEDVDRFSDAHVFDTLRALNTLVNNSGQVGRRVVFVYAIRDSVLGQIGSKKKISAGDGSTISKKAAFEIDRANRAKYFDIIIPIVPFVTADNARDLMMQVMKPHVAVGAAPDGISPALIRLVARHVADMRTLWSIRNEFEIHIDRLKTSARNAMPEITPDIVLSLVLIRATSPDAYEQIRLRTSPLDTLVERWLALVDENLEIQTKRLVDLRAQMGNNEARESRAERAGATLDSLRPELISMVQSFIADRVEFAGPLTDSSMSSAKGWQQIANGESLTVNFYLKQERSAREKLVLSPQILARLLGMTIDPRAWQEANVDDIRANIQAAQEEIRFLRHHTWEQLSARADLSVKAEPGEWPETTEDVGTDTTEMKARRINFEGLVQEYAPSHLARDLISHGFLPRHFARYASKFYGDVVGLEATEYISRAIEPGVPIIEYELDDMAIEQILKEQDADEDDADLFDDSSTYNLDIVAYLIRQRPGAARRIAGHLGRKWGATEQRFVGRFLGRKDQAAAGALAALMAPTWDQALRYTATDSEASPKDRLQLVDAVLGAINTHERSDLDADVAKYLSEYYASLSSVTDPPSEARANVVMATIAAAGASVHDLTKLSSTALAAITQVSAYPITAKNLVALCGPDHVAMDDLRSQTASRPIYNHVLDNLPHYLDALSELGGPSTPIREPSNFVSMVNEIAAAPQSAHLERFVEATSIDCRTPDLELAVPAAWPALMAQGRIDLSFGNVRLYVDEHGVDASVGSILSTIDKITTPEATPRPDRLAIAVEVLKARATLFPPAKRVAIASSMEPGFIPIESIEAEDANLVGPMLAAKLLADEPMTFNRALLARWEDLESAIAVSEAFGAFSDTTTMPVRHLAAAIGSRAIPIGTRRALVAKIESLLAEATPTDATAVTDALVKRHARVNPLGFESLCVAGASKSSLVRLMIDQAEDLSLTELRALLANLSGDYSRVASGGSGVVRFDVDRHHHAMLGRLAGITHTGAKEQQTLRYGRKLEANLKGA